MATQSFTTGTDANGESETFSTLIEALHHADTLGEGAYVVAQFDAAVVLPKVYRAETPGYWEPDTAHVCEGCRCAPSRIDEPYCRACAVNIADLEETERSFARSIMASIASGVR